MILSEGQKVDAGDIKIIKGAVLIIHYTIKNVEQGECSH
jgi:hypothetical protein